MTSGQDDRKERLAQALRTNLRRRKAQARAGETDAPPSHPEPSPAGEAESLPDEDRKGRKD